MLDPMLLFPAGFGPRGLNKPLGQFASASPRQTGARRIAGVPFVRCAGAGSGQHLVAGPGPNTRERTARSASGTNPSFPCKKHDPRKRFAHHWEDPHFPADFGHTFGHSPEIWSNTEDQVKAEIARTPVGRRKTTQTLVLCVRALVRASARTCGRNPPRGGGRLNFGRRLFFIDGLQDGSKRPARALKRAPREPQESPKRAPRGP